MMSIPHVIQLYLLPICAMTLVRYSTFQGIDLASQFTKINNTNGYDKPLN